MEVKTIVVAPAFPPGTTLPVTPNLEAYRLPHGDWTPWQPLDKLLGGPATSDPEWRQREMLRALRDPEGHIWICPFVGDWVIVSADTTPREASDLIESLEHMVRAEQISTNLSIWTGRDGFRQMMCQLHWYLKDGPDGQFHKFIPPH